MSGEHKYKEGDSLRRSLETNNARELLFFTDRQQVYRLKLSEVEATKASTLGFFLPTLLKMDEGESVLDMVDPQDYSGSLMLAFQNGKLAHIPMSAWQTKTYRKKLINAYSDKSPLVGIVPIEKETDLLLMTDDGRALIVNSTLISVKPTRNSQGITVLTLRGKKKLLSIQPYQEGDLKDPTRYRARNLPKAPVAMKPEDRGEEQLSLL